MDPSPENNRAAGYQGPMKLEVVKSCVESVLTPTVKWHKKKNGKKKTKTMTYVYADRSWLYALLCFASPLFLLSRYGPKLHFSVEHAL